MASPQVVRHEALRYLVYFKLGRGLTSWQLSFSILRDASATALARAIRAKEVSSAEVVQAYLQRIEAVNPALNAVVHLCAEAAQAEAKAADAALARGQIMGLCMAYR
jgi:Amidase